MQTLQTNILWNLNFKFLPKLLGCFKEAWGHVQAAFTFITLLTWLNCDPALHQFLVKVKQFVNQFSNFLKQVRCKTHRNYFRKQTKGYRVASRDYMVYLNVIMVIMSNIILLFIHNYHFISLYRVCKYKEEKAKYCWSSCTWWKGGWSARMHAAVFVEATWISRLSERHTSTLICKH